MRKRATVVTVSIGSPLLAAVALVVFYPKPTMPAFSGKSLSKWAEQLSASTSTQEKQEARTAIRVMCPQRISTLIGWLDYDPWPRKARLYRYLQWLPGQVRTAIEEGPLADRREIRADTASVALTALGPELGPEIERALPQFATLLNRTNDVISDRAYAVAGHLGTNGLAVLLSIAADNRNPRRHAALATIGLMFPLGTNGASAIPTLVHCTQNSDPKIVRVAAQALGMFRIKPETSVPALTAVLTNADPKARAWAIPALGRFGQLAQSAAPNLVQALQDSALEPRQEATNALLKIVPEAPTNVVSP